MTSPTLTPAEARAAAANQARLRRKLRITAAIAGIGFSMMVGAAAAWLL